MGRVFPVDYLSHAFYVVLPMEDSLRIFCTCTVHSLLFVSKRVWSVC